MKKHFFILLFVLFIGYKKIAFISWLLFPLFFIIKIVPDTPCLKRHPDILEIVTFGTIIFYVLYGILYVFIIKNLQLIINLKTKTNDQKNPIG